MEKVAIELKTNYHIDLHSVSSWSLCEVAYFQNFQETSKIDQSYPVSWYESAVVPFFDHALGMTSFPRQIRYSIMTLGPK